MAEQLTRRQYRRLHGLPPDSPPTMEGEEGVTMEIPASIEDHMELTPPRGNFSTHASPLVQLPPTTDVSVHPLLGGHGDTSTPPDYGLDAPFWRNSISQFISEFRVIRPSPGNPPLGEEG